MSNDIQEICWSFLLVPKRQQQKEPTMHTITISKIAAAKTQLVTAIQLFFEERDPVSIHTLACAALTILHDHIPEPIIALPRMASFTTE